MRSASAFTRSVTLVALALSGCAFVSNSDVDKQIGLVDADGDGVPGVFDCDDTDPRKRPGTRDDLNDDERPDGPQDWEDPTWTDIPYDGIDNDCVDGDTVDADRDQFPGISRESYAIAAVNAGLYREVSLVPWPANVFDDPVDCEDNNPLIFPTANDEPYNGVDEDCGRNNDFDADGDGQMRPGENRDAVLAYAAAIGITIDVDAPNAFGDCQDLDDAVYAGNPVDVPYDGQDSDCDGTNDFDRDGDGYRPSGYDTEFASFVALYHPTDPPAWVAASQSGDCLDLPVPELPGVDPADVNPGVTNDVSYDGVDADCAGDTDFDADADGYMVQNMETEIDAYITNWSTGNPPQWQPTILTSTALPGDCDDTDVDVAPGNIEVLGDGADSDCDGIEDGTPFAYSSLSWDKPSWPRIVRNDVHYLITTDALWAVRRSPTGFSELPDAAVNIFFSADPADPDLPAYAAEPLNVRPWANANPNLTDPRSIGLDVVSVGQTMFVGNSYYTVSNGIFKMGFVQRTFAALLNDYSDVHLANRINAFEGFETDVEMTFLPDADAAQANEGWLWMTTCGGSGRDEPYAEPVAGEEGVLRQMVIRTPFVTVPINQVVPLSPDSAGGGHISLGTESTADVCWHEVERIDADTIEATVHVCDVDGCAMFLSSVVNTTPGADEEDKVYEGSFEASPDPDPYDGRGVIEADVHGDLLILVENAGVVIEAVGGPESWTVFAGEPVISADAMITADGMLYVAAVIEAAPVNELRVAYGPANDLAALTVSTIPVTDDNPVFQGGMGCVPSTGDQCGEGRLLEPRRIGLHADEQRVVLAVSAWTPTGYVPAEPQYVTGSVSMPGRQDAVGWAFFGPAITAIDPVPVP